MNRFAPGDLLAPTLCVATIDGGDVFYANVFDPLTGASLGLTSSCATYVCDATVNTRSHLDPPPTMHNVLIDGALCQVYAAHFTMVVP